jgi:adiponectin receptor
MCHNETFNVWSHLLGKIIFLVLTLVIIFRFQDISAIAEQGVSKFHEWASENQDKSSLKTYFQEKYDSMEKAIQRIQEQHISESKLEDASSEVVESVEQNAYVMVTKFQSRLDVFFETKDEASLNAKEQIEVSELLVLKTQRVMDFFSQVTQTSLIKRLAKRVDVLHRCVKHFSEAITEIDRKVYMLVSPPPEFEEAKFKDQFQPDFVLGYVHKWPLIVHLLSACFCLGCSAIYHLFHIHSPRISDILARLDYGGISVLIMGSSYPAIFYTFSCSQVYTKRTIYMTLITVTSTTCFITSMLPAFSKPKYRAFRATQYVVLGLSAAIPFIDSSHFS